MIKCQLVRTGAASRRADEGRVVAEGAHHDLIRQGGLYVRLAALQFTDTAGPRAVLDAAAAPGRSSLG